MTLHDRFFNHVKKTSSCWLWSAYKDKNGYGRIKVNGVSRCAHVVSWAIKNKREPDNCILHSCDNPSCVNPDHLRDGTHRENTQDSVNRKRHFEAAKTRCNKGHLFSPENTISYNGARKCRTCNNDRCIARYHARKKGN